MELLNIKMILKVKLLLEVLELVIHNKLLFPDLLLIILLNQIFILVILKKIDYKSTFKKNKLLFLEHCGF